MNTYSIGTKLIIGDLNAKVIGSITYENPKDDNKQWTEYRLITQRGEYWLSMDDEYEEYSISWPSKSDPKIIDSMWHKVDEGEAVVVSYSGDVDVDVGEKAHFVEFEDDTEEKTLSLETWSDGTEVSEGQYLDLDEIQTDGSQPISYVSNKLFNISNRSPKLFFSLFLICLLVIIQFAGTALNSFRKNNINTTANNVSISEYISSSSYYDFLDTITGEEGTVAYVYSYNPENAKIMSTNGKANTDVVVKDIINGIYGNTEKVIDNNDDGKSGVAILTTKEYCLVYYSDTESKDVYVQFSDRKYNYSTDKEPYKANNSTRSWYRTSYYNGAFNADKSSYSDIPSAYTTYDGPILHDLGNGYYDVYSSDVAKIHANSIKQSSTDSRDTSGGGFSSGK